MRREIWHFRRGEVAERCRIKRTASAASFYSEPRGEGGPTLDDAITRKESDLAVSLNEVRAKSSGDSIAAPTAAAVVAHLVQRTSHARETIREGMTQILERADELFTDRDSVAALMGLDSAVPTDRFRGLLLSKLDKVPPEIIAIGLPRRVLERVVFLWAKENAGEPVEQGVDLVKLLVCGNLEPKS